MSSGDSCKHLYTRVTPVEWLNSKSQIRERPNKSFPNLRTKDDIDYEYSQAKDYTKTVTKLRCECGEVFKP